MRKSITEKINVIKKDNIKKLNTSKIKTILERNNLVHFYTFNDSFEASNIAKNILGKGKILSNSNVGESYSVLLIDDIIIDLSFWDISQRLLNNYYEGLIIDNINYDLLLENRNKYIFDKNEYTKMIQNGIRGIKIDN